MNSIRRAIRPAKSIRRFSSFDGLGDKNLSLKSTWDDFYRRKPSEEKFEWFLETEDVANEIRKLVGDDYLTFTQPPLRLADIGCGTSDVFPTLYRSESRPLILDCVDFCEGAVANLQRRSFSEISTPANPFSSIRFHVADAKQLPFADQSIDLVVDKGLGDAVLRSSSLGEFSAVVDEFLRILNPKRVGKIFQVSDEDPEARLALWEEESLRLGMVFSATFRSFTVGNDREIFFYYIKL